MEDYDLGSIRALGMDGHIGDETIQQVEQARSTGNYDDLFPEDIRRK
jgi:hypothetical protein